MVHPARSNGPSWPPQIFQARLDALQLPLQESRIDLIGVNALYRDGLVVSGAAMPAPPEVRLRLAARAITRTAAQQAGNEVEALYTNGPAGGGGVRIHLSEVVAIASILVPAADVKPEIIYEDV